MARIKGRLSRLGFVIVMIGALLLNFTPPPFQLVGVIIFLVALLRPIIMLLIDKAVEQLGRRIW